MDTYFATSPVFRAHLEREANSQNLSLSEYIRRTMAQATGYDLAAERDEIKGRSSRVDPNQREARMASKRVASHKRAVEFLELLRRDPNLQEACTNALNELRKGGLVTPETVVLPSQG